MIPDFRKTSVIQTDAFGIGLGGVLTQNGYPMSYLSKTVCPKLLNSLTYVREPITTYIQKWHHYFHEKQVIIETD